MIIAYLLLNLTLVAVEYVAARFFAPLLPPWTESMSSGQSPDIKAVILDVGGSLITADAGVLGAISIAVGLVTLIAQRDQSSIDVRVYYHESLAFELAASCIALLLVLCVQLVWPMQFALHRFLGEGTPLQIFKLVLLAVHIAWLVINFGMLAHFVATTLEFVQRAERERVRQRYIANILVPAQLTDRLTQALYASAGSSLLATQRGGTPLPDGRITVSFGFDFDNPENTEITTTFDKPRVLADVHMTLARWALRRWASRCEREHSLTNQPEGPFGRDGPLVSFPIYLNQPQRGEVGWCRRRGGVPLDRIERTMLRCAFRFKRAPR